MLLSFLSFLYLLDAASFEHPNQLSNQTGIWWESGQIRRFSYPLGWVLLRLTKGKAIHTHKISSISIQKSDLRSVLGYIFVLNQSKRESPPLARGFPRPGRNSLFNSLGKKRTHIYTSEIRYWMIFGVILSISISFPLVSCGYYNKEDL